VFNLHRSASRNSDFYAQITGMSTIRGYCNRRDANVETYDNRRFVYIDDQIA
jgi:hypothetical protein